MQLMSLDSKAADNVGRLKSSHNSAIFRPRQAGFVPDSAGSESFERDHVDTGQNAQELAADSFLIIVAQTVLDRLVVDLLYRPSMFL